MIIIYGRRPYGRVDECGGEFAQTRFFHVYYLPLVPTDSFWVTHQADGGSVGLPIKLDLKSVAAAYLRTWALVIAFGCLASASIAGVAIALVLFALSLGSYRWRSVQGARARRRSDFNQLAYGTRCDPSRFDTARRRAMRDSLEQRRAKVASPRPPEDVSRFGAANLDEAVIAYGLLRLAAFDHPSGGELAAAERLLSGDHDVVPDEQGPYRQRETSASNAPDLHAKAAVEAAAETAAHHRAIQASVAHASAEARGARGPWWKYRGPRWLPPVLLAALAVGGLAENGTALLGTRDVTLSELSTNPPLDRYVAVTCDDVEDIGAIVDANQRETDHTFFCELRSKSAEVAHSLIVMTGSEVTKLATQTRIVGKLHRRADSKVAWPSDLDAATLSPYLDLRGRTEEIVLSILSMLSGLAAIGLSVYWLRRPRRTS